MFLLVIGGRELPVPGNLKSLIEPGRVYRAYYSEADQNLVALEPAGG
jgi:hypothetical protein